MLRPRTLLRLAGAVAAAALVLGHTAGAGAAPVFTETAPMTPRLQWNANDGYCGETSLIMAGLSFGQYTSQWTARALASPGLRQTNPASQLLLTWPPGSGQRAARAMRLRAADFDPGQYENAGPTHADVFLAWVKNRFLAGDRVLIGVLNNVDLLGEEPPGDAVYDHIVPVMAIGSRHPLVVDDAPGDAASYHQRYYGDDRLTIADGGLFTPLVAPLAVNGGAGNTAGNPRGSALYTATFDGMQKSRAQANRYPGSCLAAGDATDACSPYVYAVYDNATGLGDYGMAVGGVVDRSPGGSFAVPVRLVPSLNNEGRQDQAVLRAPPAARPLTLTATVTLPDPSTAYRVYLYRDFADVPTGSFNAAAAAHPDRVARAWTIPANAGGAWTTTIRGRTDGTYVFRAVPVGAP